MKVIYLCIIYLCVLSTQHIRAQVTINRNPITVSPLPTMVFQIDGGNDTPTSSKGDSNDLTIDNAGHVFIGAVPGSYISNAKIRVENSITIKAGELKAGNMLTLTGGASINNPDYAQWSRLTLYSQKVDLPYAHDNIPAADQLKIPVDMSGYFFMKPRVTLSPGFYAINITLAYRLGENASGTVTRIPAMGYSMVDISLADNPSVPTPSVYLTSKTSLTGTLVQYSLYGLLQGTIYLNYSGTSDKTFFFIGGNSKSAGLAATEYIWAFGGREYGENSITIYKLKSY